MSTKDQILTLLMEHRGTFLSGEALSRQLSVSRAAVWKAIKTLREEGWPIEAVTNKGYLLLPDEDAITEDSLRLCMSARYRKLPIHVYDTLDSTNIRAKQLALEGAPHGTVVAALQQTAGRGRLGRSFFSPREGVYLTIIIRPDFDVSRSMLVTAAAAVAVAESIEETCGKAAGIKWVNDVYVDGKKVCGILTEGISDFETGQIEALVVGVGVNTALRGFPEGLLDVVGAVEGDYSKSALAASIICKLLDFTAMIAEQNAVPEGPAGLRFIDAYREKSLVIGKTAAVYKGVYRQDPTKELGGRPAKVLDIDENGGLCVLYTDGTRETLVSGEISIRL